MDKLVFLALIAGCNAAPLAVDAARPRLGECGVVLSEPFEFAGYKTNSEVSCSSPFHEDAGAWAAIDGPLALLRVQLDRVALITNIGGEVFACDEWSGKITFESGPSWSYQVDAEGCGSHLVGVLYGNDDLR